jgi:hypothetical protein
MLELIFTILFCWLFFKALGLAFRVAWGAAKIAAAVIFVLAIPALILCLIFAGGLMLMIPLGLIGLAFGILKTCE